MIQLAFEYPLPHHEVFSQFQDFRFGLAHYILNDVEYRKKYPVVEILDNGVHETGEPLPLKDLLRATKLCKAQHVVTPDWLHESERTLKALDEASTILEPDICAVIQAKTMKEVIKGYTTYLENDVSIIAFPFRADRVAWIKELRSLDLFEEDQWYHMMGLKDQYELMQLVDLGLQFCSLDTSKPIKAGIADCSLDLVRGLGPIDIHQRLTDEQLQRSVDLIMAMKEVCR